MIRARNRCVGTNGQIALIVHGCILTTLGWAHDDERGDGRERRATVGELKGEARGIVVVGLDGFEIEEIVGVQRGFFLGLFRLGGGGNGARSWGTAEVDPMYCASSVDILFFFGTRPRLQPSSEL